jgi:hypothetical protein
MASSKSPEVCVINSLKISNSRSNGDWLIDFGFWNNRPVLKSGNFILIPYYIAIHYKDNLKINQRKEINF